MTAGRASDAAGGADDVVAALEALRSQTELAKVRRRLPDGEPAFGLRMRDLFDTAKQHESLPLDEVHRLLDHPAYEPRMAAFCILDFKARHQLVEDERQALCDVYLGRHERITTWDMVDRAAPRVVGGCLAGRSLAPLEACAGSASPLERRTAITAPLWFVKRGSDADVAVGFAIAAALASDPEPVVHNAVGIFLKHASTRSPADLDAFLETHADVMPRAALRLARQNRR